MSFRRLPPEAVSVTAIAAVFGRDALFLTIVYVFALFALDGITRLMQYAGLLTWVADVSLRTMTMTAFVLGLAIHYLLTGKSMIETPRGVSPLIAIMALAAIYGIAAFSNVTPIVDMLYGTLIRFYEHIIETYFGGIANTLLVTLAVYILLMPRIVKWIVESRLGITAAGLVAALVGALVSTITLNIVLTVYKMLTGSLDIATWTVFAIVTSIAALLEIRRIVQGSAGIEQMMQLPAIVVLASMGAPYLGTSYVTWLSFLVVAIHLIMVMGAMIGLAVGNKKAFVTSAALAGALSAVSYALGITLPSLPHVGTIVGT